MTKKKETISAVKPMAYDLLRAGEQRDPALVKQYAEVITAINAMECQLVGLKRLRDKHSNKLDAFVWCSKGSALTVSMCELEDEHIRNILSGKFSIKHNKRETLENLAMSRGIEVDMKAINPSYGYYEEEDDYYDPNE